MDDSVTLPKSYVYWKRMFIGKFALVYEFVIFLNIEAVFKCHLHFSFQVHDVVVLNLYLCHKTGSSLLWMIRSHYQNRMLIGSVCSLEDVILKARVGDVCTCRIGIILSILAKIVSVVLLNNMFSTKSQYLINK